MKKIEIKTLVCFFFGVSITVNATEKLFPPVPEWQPDFSPSNEALLEMMVFYTNNQKDLVQFRHGTIVIVPDGLNPEEAHEFALKVISDIYHFHPDMNPTPMKDGNLVVQYNHPAFNIVIDEFIEGHMGKIQKHHLKGLATDEVLITPSGNNVFDEVGMKALYGRAFMFMDAQNPEIINLHRH
ncbi:hypothetical protein [Reinekea sp. G2M2-21]|uniref:hypothetical protein n=1 Tax=Reinekea sp. G2M2-21 TaxID=2788942 RepID=UPI0018A8EAF0|nr:hypothetical protein [Reinekea sp. G2M2-21]